MLDEIGAQVDHSLVRRVEGASETRLTMLETIREFGLADLTVAGVTSRLDARAPSTP